MRTSLRAFCFIFLASATSTSNPASPAIDALDEVVVAEEHERQRRASPSRMVRDADVVVLSHRDSVTATIQLREARKEILFLRDSVSRSMKSDASATTQLQSDRITRSEGRVFARATVELAAGIDEMDGLPAAFRFGPHTSLVDIEYIRLRNPGKTTLYLAQNAVDPETRRCTSEFGFGDGAGNSPRRYLLLADTMKECQKNLQAREIDLLFADDFPAALRQTLLDVYQPVFSRLSHRLGSEPGQVFVAWRPGSQRNDFLFERGWVRNGLLVFNGTTMQQGLDRQQQDLLRELLVREQIERRLFKPGANDLFMQSAVNYLIALTTSGLKHSTHSGLSELLPVWIADCARQLGTRTNDTSTARSMTHQCGTVVQFVYDAVLRSKSNGSVTAYGIWRELLAASFARGETGVSSAAFAGSSPDALRITLGLLDGSLDWQGFSAELDKFGVKLRITGDQPGLTVRVLSLEHFRDEDGL